MKNWILISALTLIGFTANAGTIEKDLEHFTEVEITGEYSVILKKGTKEKIEIINNDKEILDEDIIYEVEDEELHIRIKGEDLDEHDVVITITYIELTKVEVTLECIVEIKDKLTGEKIEFIADAGGKIKAEVDCEDLKASISAGGSIHLTGKAERAFYKISLGGTIGAVEVSADEVRATVTGSGDIICTVNKELKASVTGGGEITYAGDPEKVKDDILFGGTIERADGKEAEKKEDEKEQ